MKRPVIVCTQYRKESNISAKADIALRGVTSVFEVSKEAEEAWLAIG